VSDQFSTTNLTQTLLLGPAVLQHSTGSVRALWLIAKFSR